MLRTGKLLSSPMIFKEPAMKIVLYKCFFSSVVTTGYSWTALITLKSEDSVTSALFVFSSFHVACTAQICVCTVAPYDIYACLFQPGLPCIRMLHLCAGLFCHHALLIVVKKKLFKKTSLLAHEAKNHEAFSMRVL
jgi:hypothetical protein